MLHYSHKKNICQFFFFAKMNKIYAAPKGIIYAAPKWLISRLWLQKQNHALKYMNSENFFSLANSKVKARQWHLKNFNFWTSLPFFSRLGQDAQASRRLGTPTWPPMLSGSTARPPAIAPLHQWALPSTSNRSHLPAIAPLHLKSLPSTLDCSPPPVIAPSTSDHFPQT